MDSGSIPDTSTIKKMKLNIEILNFIFINLSTILIVGLVYFLSKEMFRIKRNSFTNLQITSIGIVYGIMIMIIYLFSSANLSGEILTTISSQTILYNNVYLSFSLIIIILFSIMFDKRLALPMIIFQSMAFLLSINSFEGFLTNIVLWSKIVYELLMYVIVFILLFFGIENTKTKKNKKRNRLIYMLITYLFINIFIDILYTITITSTIDPNIYLIIKISLIKILYYIAVIVILSMIVYFIERIYTNFNTLETFSTQDDVSYYKISLAQNKLRQIIDNEKIDFGALVLFDIKTADKEKKSIILNKIKQETEENYNISFFFKATSTLYGSFYQLDNTFKPETTLLNNKKKLRREDDPLSSISNSIKSAQDEMGIQTTASASLYGIHSYDLNELIEYCKFLMTPIVSRANKNPLIVYDFKRVKHRLKERTEVMNLPIDIQTIKMQYLRGINSDPIYYPLIEFDGLDGEENEFSYDFLKSLQNRQKETLLRYISYQILREFKNKKDSIVVYYSTQYIASNQFDRADFIKKINRYITPDRLIIGLDLDETNINKNLSNNIRWLKKNGIRFASTNPTNLTQKAHDLLKPDFLVEINNEINPFKIEKKEIKIKTQASPLNTNLV